VSDRPEVLFTHAYFVEDDRRPFALLHPLPPLQPAQVAAWLAQEAGASVELWDPTFRFGAACFDVAVSRIRPRIAWIHTHPTTRRAALTMIELARHSGAAVVAGGPDASLRPSVYLKAGADAVVPGEGEGPTLALLLALRSAHYRPAPELLARVPGLWYRDPHGTIRQGAGKPRPADLLRLPRPLRDPEQTRIHLERWLDHGRPRTLALSSARGCPNRCGFCSQRIFGRSYRRRAPQDVVQEMVELTERFEVDQFRFADELFLFDRHWLREFAAGLRARSLRVAFEGTAHASHLDPATVQLLADVGLERLDLRAASGSNALLERLGWSYLPADVYRAAAAIKRAGVRLDLQVLVGLPGEGRTDLLQTLEMIRIVDPGGVDITRVDPGSPALFRMDWERVIAGPVLRLAREHPPLPGPVLDAAVRWMRTVGPLGAQPGERSDGLLTWLRRPLLSALIRLAPARLLAPSYRAMLPGPGAVQGGPLSG
jgi:hypothetical protein